MPADDDVIVKVTCPRDADAFFVESPELASDMSRTVDAVVHARGELLALREVYDALVLPQTMSPLRTADNADVALGMFV